NHFVHCSFRNAGPAWKASLALAQRVCQPTPSDNRESSQLQFAKCEAGRLSMRALRPRPNSRVTRGHLSANHLLWLGFARHQIQRADEADQTTMFSAMR